MPIRDVVQQVFTTDLTVESVTGFKDAGVSVLDDILTTLGDVTIRRSVNETTEKDYHELDGLSEGMAALDRRLNQRLTQVRQEPPNTNNGIGNYWNSLIFGQLYYVSSKMLPTHLGSLLMSALFVLSITQTQETTEQKQKRESCSLEEPQLAQFLSGDAESIQRDLDLLDTILDNVLTRNASGLARAALACLTGAGLDADEVAEIKNTYATVKVKPSEIPITVMRHFEELKARLEQMEIVADASGSLHVTIPILKEESE